MTRPNAEQGPPAILVINPGSTTTEVALFRAGAARWSEALEHSARERARFARVVDQLDWRAAAVAAVVSRNGLRGQTLDAVVGRGGLLRPVQGGTYVVTDAMVADLEAARYGEHASNLGALLAHRLGLEHDKPAFVVDPVTTDEFEPSSRVSGVPGIERKCRTHALSIKAVTRCAAAEAGKELDETAFVAAHLGGGVSVCALRRGRIVDGTDALLGEGPFALERAGTLPLAAMLDLCCDSGKSREEIERLLTGDSGLKGYLDETQLPKVYERADRGDVTARQVLDAFVRNVVKWIGAMAAVLAGRLDAIVLTGGMAHSQRLVQEIAGHVEAFAPIRVYPGAMEMEALAQGVMRVLSAQEQALAYEPLAACAPPLRAGQTQE